MPEGHQQDPPPQADTAMGCTHPTGNHTCLSSVVNGKWYDNAGADPGFPYDFVKNFKKTA